MIDLKGLKYDYTYGYIRYSVLGGLITTVILLVGSVLVINYIGPNSFAEIAFGFYFNKRVLLLNDIYEPYKDEIVGWNVKCLNGDLSKILFK